LPEIVSIKSNPKHFRTPCLCLPQVDLWRLVSTSWELIWITKYLRWINSCLLTLFQGSWLPVEQINFVVSYIVHLERQLCRSITKHVILKPMGKVHVLLFHGSWLPVVPDQLHANQYPTRINSNWVYWNVWIYMDLFSW